MSDSDGENNIPDFGPDIARFAINGHGLNSGRVDAVMLGMQIDDEPLPLGSRLLPERWHDDRVLARVRAYDFNGPADR